MLLIYNRFILQPYYKASYFIGPLYITDALSTMLRLLGRELEEAS